MIDINGLVGSDATLIPANTNDERINVNIIGYCKNKTLMVALKDKTIEMTERQLKATYQLRTNVENIIYTFNTHINFMCHEPMIYFHLAAPEGNQQNTQRKHPRIPVKKQKMTLSVNTGSDQVSASLADISLDGAKLVARRRLANVDEVFYIDMLIEKGTATITLPCKVRYVRTDIQTQGQESIVFHHGVEFGALSEGAEQFIESFVRVSG